MFLSQYSKLPKKKKKKKKENLHPKDTNIISNIDEDSSNEIDHLSTTMDKSKRILIPIDDSLSNNHPDVSSINLDVSIGIKNDLQPVIGYAAEPLLPLVKACAPLGEIIYNLTYYVELAMNQTPEQPSNGLTIDESAAIRIYTIEWEKPHRSLYSMLNHALKSDNRDDLRPYFKYLKLLLTALVKIPSAPPSTIWRGVTKDMSAKFPPGTQVTWWAFSSCTNQLTVLDNNIYLGHTGKRTLFSVEAINGRIIRDHSHFVTEDEVLLLPGTHMIVQSQFSPAPELHIIHLKQVVPDVILLEPPFEGNRYIFVEFLFIGSLLIDRCSGVSKDQVGEHESFLI